MYSFEIWDKKSAINGVSAKEVIEIHKINLAGEVGIIKDESGNVSILQYNNGNPYSKSELTEILEKMIGEMNNPPMVEENEAQEE